jgi:hypothetical protein
MMMGFATEMRINYLPNVENLPAAPVLVRTGVVCLNLLLGQAGSGSSDQQGGALGTLANTPLRTGGGVRLPEFAAWTFQDRQGHRHRVPVPVCGLWRNWL